MSNTTRQVIAVLLLLLIAVTSAVHLHKINKISANNLIRLHVIANSNSYYDQDLKYRVKDRIVAETAMDFGKASDITEARAIADARSKEIENIAREEIMRRGYDYPVRIERGRFHFPAKTYDIAKGDRISSLTLPQGNYEAVRVVIGDGEGANWWCVLYPPLCFVDLQQASAPVTVPPALAVEQLDEQNHIKAESPRIEYRSRIADLVRSAFSR